MKIGIVALSLLVALSSLPAFGSAIHADASSAHRSRLALHEVARVDLDRLSVPTIDGRPNGIDGVRPVRDAWAEVAPQRSLRMGAPRRLSDIAPIPEPSAMTLFGVGVLLVVQAIPRRSPSSSRDFASGHARTR